MFVALGNQLGVLPGKSSISTQRIVILEGVHRCLEIEGVIVQLLLKGNPYLCAGPYVG